MTDAPGFDAPLGVYERRADALLTELRRGEQAAWWRVRWEHRRFRDSSIDEVRSAALTLDDAREVVAREVGFADWSGLVAFTGRVAHDPAVTGFEQAVETVIAGDVDALRAMLREEPALVQARSARRHRATLLHYVAANGVESYRQITPPSAVDVARVLLEGGAEVDALAQMYDRPCTTLSMLVSSSPPHEAGLQIPLVETLLDFGAAVEGPGTDSTAPLETALAFGFLDTARALVRRGAAVDRLSVAAGLGMTEDAARLSAAADAEERQRALALAAQHGHAAIVKMLLDSGADPNRWNPEGLHAHATPLHQAVWGNHLEVIRTLLTGGARLDIRDRVYRGTPIDWAEYGNRREAAHLLRGRNS